MRELAVSAVRAGTLPQEVTAASLAVAAPPAAPARATAERAPARPHVAGADAASLAAAAAAARDVAPATGARAALGVALLLAHRAPGALRGPAAAAVVAARAPAAAPGRPGPPGPTRPAAGHASPPRRRRGAGARRPSPPQAAGSRAVPADRGPARQPHGRHGPPASPPAGPRGRPVPAAAVPAPDQCTPVRTPLAGAFLLLNVALELGLYPDFTRPRERGLELSPWLWLAHTAAQLAGAPDAREPLWPLLAALAGEDGELRPGRAPELRTTTRRIARRLDLALGRRASARRVVRRPGEVHAGPARVDVVFPLAAADVSIRMCGLDRDPGWIPAAGRDIRFHYR